MHYLSSPLSNTPPLYTSANVKPGALASLYNASVLSRPQYHFLAAKVTGG